MLHAELSQCGAGVQGSSDRNFFIAGPAKCSGRGVRGRVATRLVIAGHK